MQNSRTHMNTPRPKNRLKVVYTETLRPALKKDLGLDNDLAVPRLKKIVLNAGLKDFASDAKLAQTVTQVFSAITGQMPVKTSARSSIAGFKIREGMQIGVKVTLRGDRMYEFLDKLINVALPKVRDFQGIPTKLDGRGGYNLGIKEWSIFPESETSGAGEKSHGLNITIHTSTKNDAHAHALLKAFGMPFRKEQTR